MLQRNILPAHDIYLYIYVPIIATVRTAEPENWPSALENVSQNVV